MSERHAVELGGCTPEPLMNYLKALAVLRIVAEQADCKASGAWRNGVFVLRSRLDFDDLVQFFLTRYGPSPIVAPWAGGSGFFGNDNRTAVDAIVGSENERLQPYREAIARVRFILEAERIRDKPSDDVKEQLIRRYRREMPDRFVDWMDTAVVLQTEGQAFSPLLGTGGNDGRLDFTQNFMQRLVQLQLHEPTPHELSSNWLRGALRGDPTDQLAKAAVGQFAPGRAGGPNGTQGMEAGPIDNPWDFMLMLEGSLFFAGSLARRMSASARDKAIFSFAVRSVSVGFGSSSDDEAADARGEIWLPLWRQPASAEELRTLFAEGRADLRGRQARDSVDFARAVACLGTDRGIDSFSRTGFLKRSGKAFLATPLGRFGVKARTDADLLRELDGWLDRYRSACRDATAPARFTSALRRIDAAIFDYCRYGGFALFGNIVAALGNAERQLAAGEKFRQNERRMINPIAGLSAAWRNAADDGSAEFRLAAALASIRGGEGKLKSLRSNLEPVETSGKRTAWAEKARSVVWSGADLTRNLSAILGRRLQEAAKEGAERAALDSFGFAPLADIQYFLGGEPDENRLAELLWGLTLVDRGIKANDAHDVGERPLFPPRSYALLKLLFLPPWMVIEKHPDHGCLARGANAAPRNGAFPLSIDIEPQVVPLLLRGDHATACRVAMRRLRASGLTPMPYVRSAIGNRDDDWENPADFDTARLAASLLFPIDLSDVNRLLNLVVRPPRETAAGV